MPPEGSSVQHDPTRHCFFIPLAGEEAILEYRQEGKTLDFYHTYVPMDERHKGLAERLVEAGFLYAKAHQMKVIPTCPYVSRAFLKRRPEFLQQLAPPADG